MATIYTNAYKSDDGLSYRVACTYTVTETATAVTVNATMSLQYKGTYKSGGTLPGSYASYLHFSPYAISTAAAEIAAQAPKTSKSSWTTLKSASATDTTEKSTYAKTVTVAIYHGNPLFTDYKASATVAVAALESYPVTYDANGGTNAPNAQAKYYGKTLTLSTAKPARDNASFVKWSGSDGNDYQPGGTYAANVALTLTAVWISVPQITSLIGVRCKLSGGTYTDDDEGTYARVSCAWSIDQTIDAQASATVTGTITPQGGTASAITIESGGSGTSGTAIAHPSNLDPDTQYSVTITVTNGTQVTSRTVIITRAFFIMDFKAGGGGIGIGRAAPASGLEVGYDATFDADVLMREDLTVTGDASAATVTDGNGNAISNHLHPSGTGGYAGLFTVAGRTAYPLFVYATAPDEADLPVTPCFVLATSDYGLWYYDGS